MVEDVHLGLPGPWAKDYREKADHYTTKIGGVPDWPSVDVGIKPELLQCGLCGTKLCLVAQVYAPVAKLNIEERTIYVFVCPAPKCGTNPQSWKVLRLQKCQGNVKADVSSNSDLGQLNAHSSKSSPEQQNVENKNHETDHDDLDLDALAEALEQAATLASTSKKKNKLKSSNGPTKDHVLREEAGNPSIPVLPCFYIYYSREQYGIRTTVGSSSNEAVLAEEIAAATNNEDETWEGETYEYDKAIGADRVFLKFKKRLDAYPEQCIRYSYGGKPLLAASKLQDAGTCSLCGSPRQYEFQLMSPLSYFLHEAGDNSSNYAPDSWTWLTIIIYTCSKSCCPSSCSGNPHSCCWGVAQEEMMFQEDEGL